MLCLGRAPQIDQYGAERSAPAQHAALSGVFMDVGDTSVAEQNGHYSLHEYTVTIR